VDTILFWSLYGLSHHSAFFDAVGIFFAEYAAYVWALILIIVAIWPNESRARNRAAVIMSVVAGLFARFAVKAAIVFAYPRPRPFVILPSVHPLITTLSLENVQSFPSGHAIFFFAIATVMYCFDKKVGFWSFVVAALISIARVYVGVHWPSDILAGAILGILTGWFTFRLYLVFSKRVDRKITAIFEWLHL